MAVSTKVYANAALQAFGGGASGDVPNIDFLSDTIKVSLHTSSYTPDQSAHKFRSSTTATEVASGNGYTTGGVTLAGKTLAVAGNVATFDSSTDPTWSTATFTARYAVIYDDTPATDATKPLLAYIDFGADLSPSNGSLVITFNASGIFTMTAS